MQPLQICIGPIIRIGRESWCLPYAGFFSLQPHCVHYNTMLCIATLFAALKRFAVHYITPLGLCVFLAFYFATNRNTAVKTDCRN